MELSWPVVLNTFVAIGIGVPIVLSFFGVPVPTRLRIVGSMAVGAALVGLLGWPVAKPTDPLGAVTLFGGEFTVFDVVTCALLAFRSGGVAYFVCYPYGLQLAPLACKRAVYIAIDRRAPQARLVTPRVDAAMMV